MASERGGGDVGVYWVECCKCNKWDIFENFEILGKYNEAKIRKMNLVCRMCTLAKTHLDAVNRLEAKIASLEKGTKTDDKTWAEKV